MTLVLSMNAYPTKVKYSLERGHTISHPKPFSRSTLSSGVLTTANIGARILF